MDVTTNFGTVKIKLLKGDQGIQGETGPQGEQGIQGEPFEFEDFTPEQLAELRADVATVYYRKLEETVYTIGDNTSTIAIPFEGYSATDMLLVNVEGLLLAEGTDYTISGSNIVLTEPITHHYTAVNFLLLTAIALSVEDFDNLVGDITSTIESEVDAWLTAHPEATTTVQDGTVTDAKLVQTGGVLERVSDLKSELADVFDTVGAYDVGTTHDTLDATFNRVMAVYEIRDVNDTFYYRIRNKTTNGSLTIRVTSDISPYNAALLQTAVALDATVTEDDGSFTIDSSVKSNAKYIIIMNATAGLEVSFYAELCTAESVSGTLYETTDTANALHDATVERYADYAQGGFNGSTGVKADSTAIVRTDTFIDTSTIISVGLGSSSGLHVQMYSYNSSGTFLGRDNLGADAFTLTKKQVIAYRNAKYVTFAVYLEAGGSFSPTDFEANGGFAVTITNISTVALMNEQTNTQFSNLLKTVGKTPMATWIDDDGVVISNAGYGISNTVVPVANAVGIPVTFAVIPPLTGSVTVDGATMTKAAYFQNLQKEGHQIVSHPDHTYWYGDNYRLDEINPSLIESLTELQSYGFLHSDMLVYPGSSGAIADVVEIARKWCECGVLSGYGTPNHLGDSTRWAIKRTFVNFENYDSLHSSDAGYVSAMAWYKSQVDDAYANGDWIVFGTHSYQFTTSTDTSDPNANTLGNLQMLMQYAVDKGLEFRTLWDAYSRRKYLFTFNEINA